MVRIKTKELSINAWEILMLFLSLYVLIELSIEIVWTYSSATSLLLERIDLAICAVFLVDFFYFLYKSDSKLDYFKSRWVDLISSIPFVSAFRILRIARFVKVLRLLRLLRGAKGLTYLFRYMSGSKMQSTLIAYVFILIVVLFYSSLAFYSFEREVNDSVNEYFDAFWWAFITVTSVGYGDVYPITKIGKVIAMILTLSGMGLFSVVTAALSAKFLSYIKKEEIGK